MEPQNQSTQPTIPEISHLPIRQKTLKSLAHSLRLAEQATNPCRIIEGSNHELQL